jgi:hypothetical protein
MNASGTNYPFITNSEISPFLPYLLQDKNRVLMPAVVSQDLPCQPLQGVPDGSMVEKQ